MIIKPKVSVVADFRRLYAHAFANTVVVSRSDPERLKHVRCSALPFCPLDFFTQTVQAPYSRWLDMRGLYYTTVGTAVHDVMQTALMQSTNRIIGDWVCRQCGTIEKFTNQQECCDYPMQYEEFSLDLDGVQGHVDTVLCNTEVPAGLKGKKLRKWLLKQTFTVVDYKTTSLANKDTIARNPPEPYREQVKAYAYLILQQYKVRVSDVLLVFIPRDNPMPKNVTLWTSEVKDNDLRIAKSNLARDVKRHKKVLRIKTKKQAVAMYNAYGTCNKPFCDTCRSSRPLETMLAAVARGKANMPLKELLDKV